MKFWMIVDTVEAPDYFAFDSERVLPDRKRPSFIHVDREKAEMELLRLKHNAPSGSFFLLEAVMTAEEVKGVERPYVRCVELQS